MATVSNLHFRILVRMRHNLTKFWLKNKKLKILENQIEEEYSELLKSILEEIEDYSGDLPIGEER